MASYSQASVSELFKIVFGKLSAKLYNHSTIMVSQMKKRFDFSGSSLKISMPGSFGGSVGSGTLPTANVKTYLQAEITTKSLYARMTIDRKSMYAAKDDKGSFVRLLKEAIENTVESYSRNLERILVGDGTGALGTMDGTNTGSDPYVVLISDASWNEANWAKGDYVNVGSDTSSLFEVTVVAAATKTITLDRITGSTSIGASDTDIIYMQNSKDNDPLGLAGTVGISTGTPYGINIATNTEFASTRIDAEGAEISPQIMNKIALQVHKKTGKNINLVMTSYEQFIKLQNQLEDQKYVILPPRGSLDSTIGFDAIEIIVGGKKVPVVVNRFLKPTEMYLLNSDMLELLHQPGFGWFDDDGTVLLRQADSDGYEARYGGYLEAFIKPAFHAQIHNLAE